MIMDTVPDTAVAEASPTSDSKPGRTTAPTEPRPLLQGIGIGLSLLGVFVLGFVGYLYGVSGLGESHAQIALYDKLRIELGGLTSQVAPIAATTPGAPVAILNIPAIGIKHMVVVEGTSPENLELGPGHLRDSPLPGEYGVSQIFGRRATFGAPFGRLTKLKRGDTVTAITGQGVSRYVVVARGSSTRAVENPDPNQLILVTACSAVVPTSYCYYDADLTSSPQQDPGGRPAVSTAELPLGGDTGALVLAMIWGLALLLISAASTVAAARWSPRLAYLAASPLVLAVLWNLYQNLAALLPNLS
jgi:sortase A